MTGTCSTPDAKTAVPIGRTPLLGENPRPAKMFLDTGIEQVAGHASREGHWGWDGACLETVSAIAHDPIGYGADINLYRYVRNNPLLLVDPSGMAYREVTCSFSNGSQIWSETVAADTSETAGQACQRRATGWGWGTAWTVIGAREGPLNPGQHKDHGGTYESDYADLRITCDQCKGSNEDKTAAELKCRQKTLLRAGELAGGTQVTSLGEGIIGTASIGGGFLMVFKVGTPWGWAFVGVGIVIDLKAIHDYNTAANILNAANAAADRYCDCKTPVQF